MNKRHRFFFYCLVALALAFCVRLIYLQVIQHDFFKAKASNQLKRIIKLYPNRGTILDRNLKPLALTEESYQVYAVPEKIKNKWEFSKAIAPALGKKRKEISDKLYETKSPFIWIARHISKQTKQALNELSLEGLGFIKTHKRTYPNNQLASHILGFVGVDNQGLGGLEYRYDDELKGSPGKIILDGDPSGTQVVSGKKVSIDVDDGQTIVTTIDSNIQFMTEYYLAKAVKKHQAESGQAIIMDIKTGDILSMASVPTFNANMWSESPIENKKIIPVNNAFEPGSIFKIITLASVLEEDIVSIKTTMHVPETYKLYKKTISEAHDRQPGEESTKSVSEIIEQSLNVGTTLLALKLGEERFYKYMREFGFGQKTNIELPGESIGILRQVKDWSGVDIAMMSFGQGIAVTGIQMTAALASIANDGVYVKPRIIKYFTDNNHMTRKAVPIQNNRRIVSTNTAKQIHKAMYNVVERVTATTVKINNYSIAGKTGTAQKANPKTGGYEKGKYIASFVGFFPVEDPKIAMLVAIDSPKKGYYGSTVAGPVFKKCAEFLIDYYNIAPNTLRKSSFSSSKILSYAD